MKIILGSASIHKLNAISKACTQIGLEATVTGIKTASGQNEQPVGLDETLGGAMRRAASVRARYPDDIAMGIESGIFRSSGNERCVLDVAVIVLLHPDGRRIVTTSSGIEFPEEYVAIAEKQGFGTTTVGSVITDKLGGDPTDPHAVVSRGRLSRGKLLADGIAAALLQM